MQDKINSLNEILESEKSVRQNWIYRYEEEQKTSANITRELISTQDKLNEMIIKFNNVNAGYQESITTMEKLMEKHKQEIDENLALRAHNEEITRKLKTSKILLEKVDDDYRERFIEHNQHIALINEAKMQEINLALMETEDLRQQALTNLNLFYSTQKQNEELKVVQGGIDQTISEIRAESQVALELADRLGMLQEDSRNQIISQIHELNSLKNTAKAHELESKKLQKSLADYRSMIPPDLKNSPNPFRSLLKQVNDLKRQIQFTEASKPILEDFSCQYGIVVELQDNEAQTNAFYIETEEDEPAHQRSSSSVIATPTGQKKKINESIEIGLKVVEKRKKNSRDKIELNDKNRTDVRKVKDSHIEELLTPLNMRSIYNNDPTNDTNETPVLNGKLPLISKRASQPSSMVSLPQPIPAVGEFKRFMKQAVSRRRNEKNSN